MADLKHFKNLSKENQLKAIELYEYFVSRDYDIFERAVSEVKN